MRDYVGLVVLNYKLIRKLGEGGFGTVFLAEHAELGRKVAVKILHAEYARRKDVVERFFREARAVCAIGHKAIVDVQNFARLDSGEPYYLMEYFEGESLAQVIESGERLAGPAIVKVFDAVASALTAAHAKSIIHRDLKPENIMVRRAGGAIEDVRLLDFGIAKLTDSSDQVASRTGFTIGTPMYMAPEQARDAKNVDVRADVYSFAATLFHVVAGRPPFVEPSITDLVVAVQTRAPPPLRTFAPDASAELEAVLAGCLSKSPADRPPTIAAAWEQLRAAVARQPVTPRAPGASPPVLAPEQSARFAKTVAKKAQTTLGSASAEVVGDREAGAPPGKALGFVALGVLATGGLAAAAVSGDWFDDTPGEPDAAVVATADAAIPMIADAAIAVAADAAIPEVVDAGSPAIDPECRPEAFASIPEMSPGRRRARAARAGLGRLRRCRDAGGLTAEQARRFARALEPLARSDRCSPRRLSRITGASKVRAALAGLERCRSELGSSYARIKRELERKLLPPIDCSTASFRRVYSSSRPSEFAVKAALGRLRSCAARGALSSSQSATIRASLERALQPPEPECSRASFARVYQASSPAESEVRAALRRLKTCKARLGSQYPAIQRALLKKL